MNTLSYDAEHAAERLASFLQVALHVQVDSFPRSLGDPCSTRSVVSRWRTWSSRHPWDICGRLRIGRRLSSVYLGGKSPDVFWCLFIFQILVHFVDPFWTNAKNCDYWWKNLNEKLRKSKSFNKNGLAGAKLVFSSFNRLCIFDTNSCFHSKTET